MRVWTKRLLVALFVTSLAGCQGVIYTQPYLVGTFIGTYYAVTENSGNPPSFPVTIKSHLVNTGASRYTFEGTAELNGKPYTMTGYEENSDGEVIYLAPQAKGISGDFVMTLQDGEGSSLAICGYVYYGLAGANLPPSLQGGQIVSAAVTSTEICNASEEVIGYFGGLEKQ